MALTSLGFVFLLLPVAAVLFYCAPQRYKPMTLCAVSAVLYLQMEPLSPFVLLALLPEAIYLPLVGKNKLKPSARQLFYWLIVAKNLLGIGLYGVALPLFGYGREVLGLVSTLLFSLYAMVEYERGHVPPPPVCSHLACTLFFGRLPMGPVDSPKRMLTHMAETPPSLSGIGQGIMRLVLGIAKQVILAEQLYALLRTLVRVPLEQLSVGSVWLAALTTAMGIYFTMSGFGDMAIGLAEIFSLQLPRLTYYPFQSPTIREHVYRLNMPLEEALGRLLYNTFDREQKGTPSYLVSLLLPVCTALWLAPNGRLLPWALWLCGLVLLDWLLFSRIPFRSAIVGRISTFLLTVPGYLFILPTTGQGKLHLLLTMFGLTGAPLYNDALLYFISSNAIMLLLAGLFCLSFIETVSRVTREQFPTLWWWISCAWTVGLTIVTTSFLLWNVRG